jgi:prepilin-type N-terminal cleavage/methylation domain-containing protein
MNCMRGLTTRRPEVADEHGFTLIELLMVLVIIGVLLSIAVPSYLGYKDRAQRRTAAANVRTAVPDAEAYFADNGTYAGMTPVTLQTIDHVDAGLTIFADASHYCMSESKGSHTAKVVGPGGTVDDNAAAQCTTATG